jgi:hypothetical protein
MTKTSYYVHGWQRDTRIRAYVIVDDDDAEERFTRATAVAGDEYTFNSTSALSGVVSETAKHRLLTEKEFYAAVPDSDWHARKRRRKAKPKQATRGASCLD